jgi:beta-N-acetylhexosaminidase
MARNRLALIVVASVATAGLVALVGWWTLRDDSTSKRTSTHTSASSGVPGTTQPAATTPSCTAQGVIATWPLEQQLAQLLMVGVDPRNGSEAEGLVGRYGVGGVFIGGEATGIFVDGSLARLPSLTPVPPFVAVDEEGGRVQRIDALAGSIPSARTMAQTMTTAQVHDLALQRGRALRELGVTMDLAPVVDVSSQSTGQVIGDRSFSSDPAVVSEYAGAFASGLREAGVFPVLKHFPGHGRATGDSHRQAAVTPLLADLSTVDLIPYRNLLTEPRTAVMTGHLDVPGLTVPNEPASISPNAVSDLLRTQLGYRGLVITDDLSQMVAITRSYSVAEAALRALVAGNDMALFVRSADLPDVLSHLVDAVASGRLDAAQVNASVQRVVAAKSYDPCASQPSG